MGVLPAEREIERELTIGRTVAIDLVRIVKLFQREPAEELGLERLRRARWRRPSGPRLARRRAPPPALPVRRALLDQAGCDVQSSPAPLVIALGLTALFVLLNGFFVAAEFSLVKLRATQLERMAKRSDKASQTTVGIFQDLDKYLSATQLGIALGLPRPGWIGEPAIAHALFALALALGIPNVPALHSVAFVLGFAGLTTAHIVFGELVPKLIAIASAERMALLVSRPLRMVFVVMYPGLIVLNTIASVILRALGYPPSSTPRASSPKRKSSASSRRPTPRADSRSPPASSSSASCASTSAPCVR